MPTDIDSIHAAASELLRRSGHRCTTGRRCIIDALHAAGRPLSIPLMLESDGRLRQSSTYRNLLILEGVVAVNRVVTFDGHQHFELDERLTRRHRQHLICSGCGVVDGFELSSSFKRSLDQELRRAGREATFRIDRHRLDLLGVCAGCS